MIYEPKIFDLDMPNKNGHVYPTDVVLKAIEEYNQKIKEGKALGNFGMPESMEQNLDQVSHVVEEIHIDGDKAYAKVRTLDTPYGHIVRQLIEDGALTDLRTTGTGMIDENGVISDYQLLSVNFVKDGA